MRILTLFLIQILSASSYAGPIPRVAPTSDNIAKIFALLPRDVRVTRRNIDPILARDSGIRWDYNYILDAPSKKASLRLAVLSPKYLPTPTEAVADPKDAATPQRKLVEPNGDIVYIYSCPAYKSQTKYVVRVERHQGDWDLLLQFLADDATKTANASFLEDTFLHSSGTKINRLLTNETEQAGAGQPATKAADKAPTKDQPSTPTSKDGPR